MVLLLLLFLLLLTSQKSMLLLQCCCRRPYTVDVQYAVISNGSGVPSIASLSAVVLLAVPCFLIVVNTPSPPVLATCFCWRPLSPYF